MGDSRIFKMGSLYRRCETQKLIHPDLHLIADSAYELKTYLMKNFPRASTTVDQRTFNSKMNSARSTIENAHARLKNRWRRLNMLDFDVSKMGQTVLACALLHNVLQKHKDIWAADAEADERKKELDDFDAAADDSSDTDTDGDGSDSDSDSEQVDDASASAAAKAKRDSILQELLARRARRRSA